MRKNIDIRQNPTPEQIDILQLAEKRTLSVDAEYPEFTDVELQQFRRVAQSRQKQTVTIRLSPRALSKAKSLGKGYTSVLGRILENAMENPETFMKYL